VTNNTSGTVRICDPAEEGDDVGTVKLCDPAEEGDVGRLRFCDEDNPQVLSPQDPCYGIDPMKITGTAEPDEGSWYTVTGGKPPYTWTISDGTINDNGVITDLDGVCGSGTVTVTDACGQTATKDIRFPDGQWVLVGEEAGPCGEISGLSCNPGGMTCSDISGDTKTVYTLANGDYDGCISGLDCASCVYINALPHNPCTGQAWDKETKCGPSGYVWVISKIDTYHWECL